MLEGKPVGCFQLW